MKKLGPLWLVVMLGCSSSPLDLPPRPRASAILAGRVIDANGVGVRAAVRSTLYVVSFGDNVADPNDSDCVTNFPQTDTLSTDASGRFRKLIEAGAPQFLGCFVLEAIPPEGSEWRSAEVVGDRAYFRSATPGAVLDSIDVLIRLPRR